MCVGTVLDIQRMSVHDGPGIRTTVFLKGCSLHCFWCHNPESIKKAPQLLFFKEKCMGCAACLVCKQNAHTFKEGKHIFDATKCIACGACAEVCLADALQISGKRMSVEAVMEEVKKDISFYNNSNGGVTISGGEPLLQVDFVCELLKRCKQEGIHTAVETAGHVPYEHFEKVLPYTDLFLYDCKSADKETHKNATGQDNTLCFSNMQKLLQKGAQVCVRVPVIPTVNDSEQQIKDIVSLVYSTGKKPKIELLPFHRMGKAKYDALSMHYLAGDFVAPKKEHMEKLNQLI